MKTRNHKKTKRTSRQIIALAGVILLALLYLVTLVVAFVDQSASGRLFWVCLFATIVVPLLLWIYIWLCGKLTDKPTMEDMPAVQTQDGTDPAAFQASADQKPHSP